MEFQFNVVHLKWSLKLILYNLTATETISSHFMFHCNEFDIRNANSQIKVWIMNWWNHHIHGIISRYTISKGTLQLKHITIQRPHLIANHPNDDVSSDCNQWTPYKITINITDHSSTPANSSVSIYMKISYISLLDFQWRCDPNIPMHLLHAQPFQDVLYNHRQSYLPLRWEFNVWWSLKENTFTNPWTERLHRRVDLIEENTEVLVPNIKLSGKES